MSFQFAKAPLSSGFWNVCWSFWRLKVALFNNVVGMQRLSAFRMRDLA